MIQYYDRRLNVVAVGKSGVGKSSFLNYLCGKDVFKTGIGEPVTQTSFDKEDFWGDNGVKYTLVDTVGLEPGYKAENCIKEVIEYIERCEQSENLYDWVHSIFYCFAASDRRIEPYELNYIKILQKHAEVVIILTKSDAVESKVVEDLSNQIKQELGEDTQIEDVCSVTEVTRKRESHPYGREKVLGRSFYGLWNTLAQKLPMQVAGKCIHIKDSNYEETNIYQLVCTPSLSQLGRHNLDSDDREWVKAKVIDTNVIIDNVVSELENLVDVKWKEQYNIIEECFDFYKGVSNKAPQGFRSDSSFSALCLLYRWYTNEFPEYKNSLTKSRDQMAHYIKEIDNCWIFDDEEKRMALFAYEEWRSSVVELAFIVSIHVQRFISAYSSELKTYGSYCLLK